MFEQGIKMSSLIFTMMNMLCNRYLLLFHLSNAYFFIEVLVFLILHKYSLQEILLANTMHCKKGNNGDDFYTFEVYIVGYKLLFNKEICTDIYSIHH